MKRSLFNKNIEPSCIYCVHGARISETEVACVKKGVVDSSGSCGRFRYDPLKREPAHCVSISTDGFSEDDFVL